MNGEDPVAPDELVLRRIHKNNVNPDVTMTVKRCEFEPKPRDTDGISLYRERDTSVSELVAAARSPNDCYVARIPVREILALGINLVPTLGDLPGHVSIPELTHATFQADRAASKELQLRLAELASRHIVHSPPGE